MHVPPLEQFGEHQAAVGRRDGAAVGLNVGPELGLNVGLHVLPASVGTRVVGLALGLALGAVVLGLAVGLVLGLALGAVVGCRDGAAVGLALGLFVGGAVPGLTLVAAGPLVWNVTCLHALQFFASPPQSCNPQQSGLALHFVTASA